jgi:hypothetical protein
MKTSNSSTVGLRESKGKAELHSARGGLFGSTKEPSEAPNHDDAVRERIVSGSSGSKSGNRKPVVSEQQEVASKKGEHNGRKHPKSEKAGGCDYAAGASNGGTVGVSE